MQKVDLPALQALVSRGRLLQALEEAQKVGTDGTRAVEERVSAWLVGVRCASVRGLHSDARRCAQQARSLAEGAGYQEGSVLALLYEGSAHLHAGDPGEAEPLLLEFMARLEALPGLHNHKPDAYCQLALCYERQKRIEPAVGLYEKGADLYHQAGNYRLAVTVHQSAAWLLLRKGQAAAAEKHLNAAALLLPQSDDVNRADQLAMEAAAYLQQGQHSEAIRCAEEVLVPGCPGAKPWSRTCAAWAAGTVAVEQGRPELAQVMLQAALKDVTDCMDPALMNLVNELRCRLAGIPQ